MKHCYLEGFRYPKDENIDQFEGLQTGQYEGSGLRE